MAKLSLYLPPFAGDYSGACSTLFGLDCLVIVIDARCCTRNYVEYDEPRWNRQRKSTFSAQLRTVEAVLGDDERILKQTIEAAEELQPACIALVGTPVPAIVGMDVVGMAYELESRCGVPAIGISTTGFETYEHGVSLALMQLCRRFAGELTPEVSSETPGSRPRVNLLGMSPHDYMDEEHAAAIEKCVVDRGFEIAWSTAGYYNIDDMAATSSADVSLVVSRSGLNAARLLRDRYDVPFTMGFPAGTVGLDAMDSALRKAIAGERMEDPLSEKEVSTGGNAAPVLIVGEQVASNALRLAVRASFARKGIVPPVNVASFFSMESDWMEPDDMRLGSEADLIRYVREHPGLSVVGDPLLRRFPGLDEALLLKLPHEALSGTLFADVAPLPGAAMDDVIDMFVESCMDRNTSGEMGMER